MDFSKIKPAKDFKAVVTEIKYMTKDVIKVLYQVKKNDWFDFEAGQFVNLKFELDGKLFQRAYSIASAPMYGKEESSGFRFELCVKIVPEGKAGKYFQNLKVGDVSKLKGPFGFCTLPDYVSRIVLVATGTGLAPIKSILEDIQFRNVKFEKATVLFGVCRLENVFYENVLKKFSKIWGEKFEYKICLSRQNLENYEYGRVTSFVSEFLNQDCHLYLCGNNAMIKEIKEMAIKSRIDVSSIHIEVFD